MGIVRIKNTTEQRHSIPGSSIVLKPGMNEVPGDVHEAAKQHAQYGRLFATENPAGEKISPVLIENPEEDAKPADDAPAPG